ncbi:hypothetical protein CLV53_11218 [Sediminibacterium magnilacihabitans]|jgi:hypothetical protein|nr:hypothetical protein CLV53_11218 [Sediminibacterium magnilacihabitans]
MFLRLKPEAKIVNDLFCRAFEYFPPGFSYQNDADAKNYNFSCSSG